MDSILMRQAESRNQIHLSTGDIIPLTSVFLADERNRDFVIGRSTTLPAGNSQRLFPWILTFLGVGLCLIASALAAQYRTNRINNEGITTQGIIIDLWQEEEENREGYYLTFQYDAKQHTYTHEQFVTKNTYKKAHLGDFVTVRYVPANPALAQLQGDLAQQEGNSTQLRAGMVICILLLGLLIPMLASIARHQILIRRGKLIRGKMSQSAGHRSGYLYWLRVRYNFISPRSGKPIHDGWMGLHGELQDSELPPSGADIIVLYVSDSVYRLM